MSSTNNYTSIEIVYNICFFLIGNSVTAKEACYVLDQYFTNSKGLIGYTCILLKVMFIVLIE